MNSRRNSRKLPEDRPEVDHGFLGEKENRQKAKLHKGKHNAYNIVTHIKEHKRS